MISASQLRRIDGMSWLAIASIVVGWFWLDALVATFGPLQHSVRFYELAVVMLNPRRLLWGLGQSISAGTLAFALICLVVIALPVLPRIGFSPARRLLIAAPLLWMLLCGTVLYVKASSAHLGAPESMGRMGGYLASWANGAMDWTGDVVARHIAIGPGTYLSLIGSGWLALKGAIELRASEWQQTAGPHHAGPGK